MKATTPTSATTSPPLSADPANERAAMRMRTYAPVPQTELAKRLTPIQFAVTQYAATEPPFQNAYFDNHEAGIYVDVATGEPLFSSRDKFDSGTGWPSFSRPIEKGRVASQKDVSHGMVRTEVVSAAGGSHLGHVFPDGPAPTGLRYCINSASLRFIPAARLVAEGYGEYTRIFEGAQSGETPPPATANSCALPPPGSTPGCQATLEVAVFGRADGDDRAAKIDGVLEVAQSFEGDRPTVEVTFDPSKVTYADLLGSWTKGRETLAVAFPRTDAQAQAAAARGVRVTR